MKDAFIIGLDPGSPITMGMISPDCDWIAHAQPQMKGVATKTNDPKLFIEVLRKWRAHANKQNKPLLACVETAHPRPREGVTSVGKYIGSYWMIRTGLAALSIPYMTASPRVWKHKLGLDDDKLKSIRLAKRVFHGKRAWRLKHQKDHDYAEAALLAYYMREHGHDIQLIK